MWSGFVLGISLLAAEFYKPRLLYSAVEEYVCRHTYNVEILSLDPLALYINNFISGSEIDHLFGLAFVLHLLSFGVVY